MSPHASLQKGGTVLTIITSFRHSRCCQATTVKAKSAIWFLAAVSITSGNPGSRNGARGPKHLRAAPQHSGLTIFRRITMPTVYLFADTNLFLHYKDLDQIDWSVLGTFEHIEVVVCTTVQSELDALKDGPRGRRSERARRTANKLVEITQHGPQVLRKAGPRVTLNLYLPRLPKPDLAEQLDYTRNDDRIIGFFARFIDDNPCADARLITRDSGIIIMAGQMGMRCVTSPEAWQLPPESDPRDSQIKELRQEIQELRAHEPVFTFSCDQESNSQPHHVTIPYQAFQPLTEAEQSQLFERLIEVCPPKVADRLMTPAQDITKYEEEEHPAWVAQCQQYMQFVHAIVQHEHFPELTINIQNAGSRPGNNALVDIRASENFGLTTPMEDLKDVGLIPTMERPIPPRQPRNMFSLMNNLNIFDLYGLSSSALDLPMATRGQEDLEYTETIKLEPARSIGLTCGLWRHSREARQFTIRLLPPHTDRPTTGQITCTVHADNLTKPATYVLVVTVSPENRPTLDPATHWFTTPHPNE